MKKHLCIGLLFVSLASGCAITEPPPAPSSFDLGSLEVVTPAPALPPLAIAHIDAPSWLDSPRMFYRLAYDNVQQARPYGSSRWSAPPAQLFEQRIKTRMGASGVTVVSASAGAMRVPVLYIELDEFTQVFTGPAQSAAHVTVRVAVLDNRVLIAQKTFMKQHPAATADAPGGVRALAVASDAVIADMLTWIAQLPLKK